MNTTETTEHYTIQCSLKYGNEQNTTNRADGEFTIYAN